MGWTWGYNWQHRRQMIDEFRADLVGSGCTVHLESSINHGRIHYFVLSRAPHGVEGEPDYYKGYPSCILVLLCDYDAKDQTWGYKDISEDMGPIQPCPRNVALAADKLGPAPNDWARKWRDAALANRLPRVADWPPGARFRWAGRDYLVTRPVGSRSVAARRVVDGVAVYPDYKFTMNRMARAVRVEV